MRKHRLLYFVLLVAGVWLVSALTGRSLVVPLSHEMPMPGRVDAPRGAVVRPLSHLNFEAGTWVAYLVVSSSDVAQLPPALRKANCWRTTDVRLLKQMQREWQFVATGGDVATVESAIYLFCDQQLVFQSGIVLDQQAPGLQSRRWGWLKSVNETRMMESVERFTRVLSPVVLL